MKKACLVVSAPYAQGEIFNRANTRLNRDNCLAFFHCLQDAFAQQGVRLNTQDIHHPEDSEIVIYNEMPRILPLEKDVSKSYLLLFESALIRPDNWDLSRHLFFSKIFTWHDEFVDQKHYFKMNFTHAGDTEFVAFENKSKFCTLIAGDKSVHHPLELYSERRAAIRWFESFHPEKFEFYGIGWDQFTFQGPKWIRIFNRIQWLRNILAEKWPSYKGRVDSKLETLKKYKFAICYENARDIPGYITEKIFDCFAAGCIPVYWGAPNIADFIPEECFIDKRKFETYEQLYAYLESMTATEYNHRLAEIQKYLKSQNHELFSPQAQAEQVSKVILSP
jgi:hypothetical protein